MFGVLHPCPCPQFCLWQGPGLSALVAWWPCGQTVTPVLFAILILTGLPNVPEESSSVCSYFLTQAGGELWEQDVEMQQCISERRRK